MKSVSNCAIFENKVHCLRLILKLDEIALERLALNFAGNLEWLGDNLLGLQNSEKWEFTLENRCRYNRKETSELSEKRSSLEGPDGDERRWQEKNSQAMHRYVDDMFLPRKGPKWTSCPKRIFFHDRLWNNAFIVSIHLIEYLCMHRIVRRYAILISAILNSAWIPWICRSPQMFLTEH